jgi:hypothetical protein
VATLCSATTITRVIGPAWAHWMPGSVWVLDGERLNADDVDDGMGVDWSIIDESEWDDDGYDY